MRFTEQGKRHEYPRQPEKCPACDERKIAEILYGMPAYSAELQADLDAGRIVLGGCCIGNDDPAWQCTACGAEIHRRG